MNERNGISRRTLLGATCAVFAATAPAAERNEGTNPMSNTLDSIRQRNVATAREFFQLLQRKDIEGWARLWSEQGRILVFYPPQGFATSIDGKAEILRGFRELFAKFETFACELTGVYPAADAEAVCVEYNVLALLHTGTQYTNSNIAIFKFRDGLIHLYHDYFDPRRFQKVVDTPPRR